MTMLVACLVMFLSVALTVPTVGMLRRSALARDVLDIPNERSSHAVPTPSGGGLAIICSWILICAGLLGIGLVDSQTALAIGPPAILIAAIGFVDDQAAVSALLRFVIQCGAVIWFLGFLHVPLFVGIGWLDELPVVSYAVSGFALVWFINLFNFMDGLDGIAGSEAVFISSGMVLILVILGKSSPLILVNVALAGACLGFLIWNWPPAKIFMGDVGSSSLGFSLGAIALLVSSEYAISIWPWVILSGVFLVDATVTLVRRGLSDQQWHEAHRSHAYQRLARRCNSHRTVTLAVVWVDVCWLLPMAVWAAVRADYAAAIAGLALLPLVVSVFWLGAGRSDGV